MANSIHPTAIISDNVRLGDHIEIGPFCQIGDGVTLHNGVKIVSHVSLVGNTTLHEDVQVFPNASIGHPPQDISYKGEDVSIEIGARTILRENVTVHPGTPRGRGKTTIGEDCFLMVGSHIAHDCIIGDNNVFANAVQIGGHVVTGEHVWIGGSSAVHQFCRIGKHAFIGGVSPCVGDVIPYGAANGNPSSLEGINIVGLKRRGFSRDEIHDLRAAYRLLFAKEGTFKERVEDVAALFVDNSQVMDIIEFVKVKADRSLCTPE